MKREDLIIFMNHCKSEAELCGDRNIKQDYAEMLIYLTELLIIKDRIITLLELLSDDNL